MSQAAPQVDDKWFLSTEIPDLEERRIYDRFSEAVEAALTKKPELIDMMEVLGDIDWRASSGARALVKAGLRDDFDSRTLKDVATVRKIVALLQMILDNEDAVFDVLLRAKKRKR